MKKGNIDEFCKYLEEQVAHHSMYCWSGQGQTGNQITEYWIRKCEQNTGGRKVDGHYKTYADIAVDFWKKQCELGYHDVMSAYDCSGLGVHWLLMADVIATDRTSNGMFRMCELTDKPHRGYWVFRLNDEGRATHIGYCVSDSEVIHAKGRQDGVVREQIGKIGSYWHKVGKPNCMDFEPEPTPPTPTPTEKYVHPKGHVRVRDGNGKYNSNGKENKVIKPTATEKNYLPYLGQAEDDPYWYKVLWSGQEGYISSKPCYTEVIEK